MRGRNFPLISQRNLIFLKIALWEHCRFSSHVTRFSSMRKATSGQCESSHFGYFLSSFREGVSKLFPLSDWIVNILGFADSTVSIAIIPLCCWCKNSPRQEAKKWMWLCSNEIYLQKEVTLKSDY